MSTNDEQNAVTIPCEVIQKIIDKMLNNDKISDEEIGKAVSHIPNCHNCLSYITNNSPEVQ